MHDIFLSYSTQDRERLQPLFQALERQGWSVFWDHRTIDIGEHWSKKINRAIRTSKCVVVVWSKASVDSEWVLEEANIGKQRNVLLPIQIDAVDIPVGFTMRQTGDFAHWDGDVNDLQFIRLAEKVGELVAQHDAEQARLEAVAAAEKTQLANEKKAAEQRAREKAEQQRRAEAEARQRHEAAEQERRAKEKAAAEQKAREAARQKQLAQERAAEQKARAEAERQAKINNPDSPGKKIPLIPVLLLSTAVLGGGGYYWHQKENSPVGASPAGDSPVQQTKEESLAGQAPTVAPQASVEIPTASPDKKPFEPEMVAIDGGTFMMGCDGKRDDVEGGCVDDEKPAHKVTVNSFQMGKYEVTFDQWDECEKAKVCPHVEDQGWGRGDLPVINVSWDDITRKYIPWLNKETGKTYRLPTEAEWEYAARGGTDTAYPWGDKASHEFANYGKDECCDGLASGKDKWVYTSPVGSFAANGYGLYDMNGNVWEWVQDRWHSDYKGAPVDGGSWESGDSAGRVLRGGSWNYAPRNVRSAYRSDSAPGHRHNLFGFRLASGQ
ncbi:MAG: SUMF1/EgtB/PvdO family nonheme iron enzyme [Gammaproteobacteria bacterium]|nr:SUMF1/EgtB/PvdO family nonheme iron enzyme [Gammaproteobacteria bacterium]MBU1724032.1 SUMF1/EgtB/PvdO family nonheme iron enzyme [Gammaproteobacteria bacterium]MBU2006899.1 SUMF1/EgtB/PvdO family nonheme iron enzyme [Gammaproteobacteria bacterium]